MQRRLPALLAAFLLGTILLLYFFYPSAAYTGDGTLFADLVRQSGKDDSPEFFRLLLHPHHFLYGPLAVGFVRALGPSEGILHPEILRLSHLSSLLGVAALGIFLFLLRRATGDPGISLSLTLLLAFSHSFWYFSESVEIQALNLFALTLFLTSLSLSSPGLPGAARLGLAHGFTLLSHVTNLLLALPAAIRLWEVPGSPASSPPGPGKGRVRLHRFGTYFSSLLLVAAVPYLAALPWLGIHTPQDLLDYLHPRYHPSDYLHPPIPGTLRALGQAETVVLGRPVPPAPPQTTETAAGLRGLRMVLRALLIGLLLGPLLSRPRIEVSEAARRLRGGSLWTLAGFAPFWLVWDPGNPEFLVLALPPVLAVLGIAYVRRHPPGRGAGHHAVVGMITGTACLLGIFHFLAAVRPQSDPGNNPSWIRTRFLCRHTTVRDLLVIPGVGEFRAGKFYLRYFGPRRRIVLQWRLQEEGDPLRALASLREDLTRERAGGARIFVTSDLFDPAVRDLLRDRYGFPPAYLQDLLRGWRRKPVGSLPDGFTVWELLPEPGGAAPPHASRPGEGETPAPSRPGPTS